MSKENIELHVGDLIHFEWVCTGGIELYKVHSILEVKEPVEDCGTQMIGILPLIDNHGRKINYVKLSQIEIINIYKESGQVINSDN